MKKPIDAQTLTQMANAALRQAEKKAIEVAKRTGTPVIVWEDGEVKEVSPDDFPDFDQATSPEDVDSQ